MSPASPRPLVVFDLDGTLIDTAPDLIASLNRLLTEENIPPIDYDVAKPMIGGGILPLLEKALAAQQRLPDRASLDALFARYIRLYQDHIADLSRPYPGLEAALDDLTAKGFAFAVCTNKYEALSVRLLDALTLSGRFVTICGQDTFPMKKPDPQMLLRTIERAGGDPRRAVMVGDSITDVRTARAAGIPVIGVDFGYTDIPMAELEPDRLIGHFDRLPEAVAECLPGTLRRAN